VPRRGGLASDDRRLNTLGLVLRPEEEHAGERVHPTDTVTDDFAELFRVHYPRLVRALQLSGGAGLDAEDIAQEAFARTLRHWRRVRAGTNPAGYVFRTAFHLLGKRGLLPATPLDESAGSIPDTSAAAILRVDLDRALATMPPRRRACVVLVWCLDLTPVDAAEALSIAPGTVRKQLDLARAHLRPVVSP
jgi:RNA polymerase sigma factor (sigma-70 family)